VLNRYAKATPAIAYVRNFGLKRGAIASSVAHDSHNIIAVGTSDREITRAINIVIEHKGALSLVNGNHEEVLPLPIAGLMSDRPVSEVAASYTRIDRMAKSDLGSTLRAPFMSLSFLALLVIPELKLSDRGLFDGLRFEFVGLQA
jgi:adenine deaminase